MQKKHPRLGAISLFPEKGKFAPVEQDVGDDVVVAVVNPGKGRGGNCNPSGELKGNGKKKVVCLAECDGDKQKGDRQSQHLPRGFAASIAVDNHSGYPGTGDKAKERGGKGEDLNHLRFETISRSSIW